MKTVWVTADVVVSPLGETTQENFERVVQGASGIKPIPHRGNEMVLAGMMDDLEPEGDLTRFEVLCCQTLERLLAPGVVKPSRTLLILSTTKGNIENLGHPKSFNSRTELSETAEFLRQRFGFAHQIVVSNACISGVLAMIIGKRFIQSEYYEEVVVLGADVLTNFVISGFQSLLALSNEPCRPFDESRKGINLGEGAAAVLLSARPPEGELPVELRSGAVSNDANHISGPSRTGEELSMAIDAVIKGAKVSAAEIDFVSAHGTATLYNDEMEAKAFSLSGLSDVPLHSLKGYYGHTLGAAGVIETALGLASLRNGILIPCLGYSTPGVSHPVNVITVPEKRELKRFLKTSSGFGGCNAAMMLQKY